MNNYIQIVSYFVVVGCGFIAGYNNAGLSEWCLIISLSGASYANGFVNGVKECS